MPHARTGSSAYFPVRVGLYVFRIQDLCTGEGGDTSGTLLLSKVCTSPSVSNPMPEWTLVLLSRVE